MAKLDMTLLELEAGTYRHFQDVFTYAYRAFTKGKEKLILSQMMGYDQEDKEKSGNLNTISYTHARRTLLNLNLQGFVRLTRVKPPKVAGERTYSFLEIYPTEKGFTAYKKGALCPVPTTVTMCKGDPHYRQTIESNGAPHIGIGKGYPGKDNLYNRYFLPVKSKLSIANTRWDKDWIRPFNELWNTTLCALKEEEAKVEIESLVERLVPTLPVKKRAHMSDKYMKLGAFITN